MAIEETSTLQIELKGAEKAIANLAAIVEHQNTAAASAQIFVKSLAEVERVIKSLAGSSLENLGNSIGIFGTELKEFGKVFLLKGVQAMLQGDQLKKLATNLSLIGNAFTGSFKSTGGASKAIVYLLKEIGEVINNKNFAASGPELRDLSNSLNRFAKVINGINLDVNIANALEKLFNVLHEFLRKPSTSSAGNLFTSLGTGIIGLNNAFVNSRFLTDPNNANFITALSSAIEALGNAFILFGTKFSGTDIASNVDIIIEKLHLLNAAFQTIATNNAFTAETTAIATAIGQLAKAFAGFTRGTKIAQLEQNSQALINFIHQLATIDVAKINPQLITLADSIDKLVGAGRAIGALERVAKVGAGGSKQADSALRQLANSAIFVGTAVKNTTGFIFGFIAGTYRLIRQLDSVFRYFSRLLTAFRNLQIAIIKFPFQVIAFGFNTIVKVITGVFSTIGNLIGFILRLVNVFNIFGRVISTFVAAFQKLTSLFTRTEKAAQEYENVVEELSSSQKQLVETTMRVHSVGDRTANTVKELASNTKQYASSLVPAIDNSTSFILKLGAMTAGFQLLKTAFRSVSVGFGNLGRDILDAKSESETLLRSLTVFQAQELVDVGKFDSVKEAMGQAAKNAEALNKEFVALGTNSPFETIDVANIFKTLQTFKFATEDAKTLTRVLIDAGSGLGSTGTELTDIALIFGQIRAAGKLLGQDLKQLQTRGIAVGPALAEAWKAATGEIITANEALEKASAGAVNADFVIAAIAKSLDTTFAGTAAKATSTVQGLSGTLSGLKKELLLITFGPVVDEMAKFINLGATLLGQQSVKDYLAQVAVNINSFLVPAMTNLVTVGKFVFDFFRNLSPEAINTIVTMGKVAGAIVGLVAIIGTLTAAWGIATSVAGLFLNPIGLIVTAVKLLTTAFFLFRPQIEGFITSVGDAARSIINSISQTVSNTISRVASSLPTLQQVVQGAINLLSKLVTYGANIITSFAKGILSAIQYVVDALGKLGSVIAHWLRPGSPPRLLPNIDEWGAGAATAYLEGFQSADFKSIGDFGRTLEELLKSIGSTADVSGIVQLYAEAIKEIKDTGELDTTGLFGELAGFAPGAVSDVTDLFLKYVNLTEQTQAAQRATKEYEAAIAGLSNEISGIEDISTLQLETSQIERFEKFAKSTFATEEQRAAALLQADKIRAQQKLREIKRAADSAKANEDAAQADIDALKERINLAQQLAVEAEKEVEPVDGGADSDKADKLKEEKEKIEKLSGDLEDVAGGLSGSLSDIESVASGFSELDFDIDTSGITGAFDALKNINTTVLEQISTKFYAIVGAVSEAITQIKLFATALFNATSVKFTEGDTDVFGAIFSFDFSSAERIGASLGRIAGTIGANIQAFADKIKGKIGEIKTQLEAGEGLGDAISVVFTGIDIETHISKLRTSFNSISDFITKELPAAFASGKAGNAGQGIDKEFIGGIQAVANAILETGPISTALAKLEELITTGFEKLRTIPIVGVFASIGHTVFEAYSSLVLVLLDRQSITGAIDTFIAETSADFERVKDVPTLGPLSQALQDAIVGFNETLKLASGQLSISDFIKNLIPTGDTNIGNAFTIITGGLDSLQQSFGNFATSELATSFRNFLAELLPFLGNIAAAIGGVVGVLAIGLAPELSGILADMLDLLTAVLGIVNDTVDAIFNLATGKTTISEFFLELGGSFLTRVGSFFENVDSIASHLVDIIPNVLNFLQNAFGVDLSGAIATVERFRPILEFLVSTVLVAGIGKLASKLPLVGSAFTFIGERFKIGFEVIKDVTGALLTNLPRIFVSLLGSVTGFLAELVAKFATTNLRNIVLTAFAVFETLGSNIAIGIIGGLTSILTSNWVGPLVDKILILWANFWDSHSPSKVADEKMGKPIGEGIIAGIMNLLKSIDFSEVLTNILAALGTLFTGVKSFYAVGGIKVLELLFGENFTAESVVADISSVFDSIGVAFDKFSSYVGELGFDILTLIFGEDAANSISGKIQPIIETVKTLFTDFVTFLGTLGLDIIQLIFGENTAGAGLGERLQPIIDTIKTFIGQIGEYFATQSFNIVSLIFGADTADSIAENLAPFIEAFSVGLDEIKAFLSTFKLADIFAPIRDFIDGLAERVETIKSQFNIIKEFFDGFKIPNIFDSLEIPPVVMSLLEKAGFDIGTTVTNSAESELDIMIPTPEFDESAVKQVGHDLTNGYVAGIEEQAAKPGLLKRFADSIFGAAKTEQESNSPSLRAAREIGVPFAEGVLMGIQQGIDEGSINLGTAFETLFEVVQELIQEFNDSLNESFSGTMIENYVTFAEGYNELVIAYNQLFLATMMQTYVVPIMALFVKLYADLIVLLNGYSVNYQSLIVVMNAAIISLMNQFSVTIIALFKSIYASILTETQLFSTGMLAIFSSMIDAIVEIVRTLGSRLIAAITSALNEVRNAFDGKEEPAYLTGILIGEAIADGVSIGINNKVRDIIRTVKNMVSDALGAAKEALKSNSPSKVTENEIGIPFGQGIEIGIVKSFKSVTDTLAKQLEDLSTFDVASPTISGGEFNSVVDAIEGLSGGNFNNNSQASRAIDASRQTSTVNNFNREFNLYMTVTPERAANIQRNFDVAEFIGGI